MSVESEIKKEVAIALLHEKIETLTEALARTDRALTSLQGERDKALRWGLVVLGSAVLSMGLWIFALLEKALIRI